MIRAKLSDGTVLNIDIPANSSDQEIQSAIQGYLKGSQPVEEPKSPLFNVAPSSMIQPRKRFIDAKNVAGMAEVAGTMATGAVAEPVAGIAGLTRIADPEKAAKTIESTRETITRMPVTEAGKAGLQKLGRVVGAFPDFSKIIGDFVMEQTDSPVAATVGSAIPTLAGELVGLKGLKSLKKGTVLLDNQGRPTRKLRQELDKQGLDYEMLSDAAKESIPSRIDPGLISTPSPKTELESAIIQQIKAGGRDDSLSGLKVERGRIKPDKIGNNAMKQGFSPGLVQTVKTATQSTKDRMVKMLNMVQRIKKQERLGLKFRPTDVVGDSVSDRVKFIRDKANEARKELSTIANDKLAGQDIDTSNVLDELQNAIGELDVTLVDKPSGGKPVPNFKESLISKDRSSQKAIKDLVDLMAEGGKPDALRLHKLKRQLDIMIDYKKKGPVGLTDAGKKVLKRVRASINDSLRQANPDYARVNDTLSTALGALDNLDKSVGTIDIFGPGANKAVGQKMRSLMSNQEGRVKLENAIDGIEDAVESLGGKFEDDVRDLVLFSNALDERFGTSAKTSLAGQITQASEETARRIQTPMSKKDMLAEGVKIAGKGVEKLRGINDSKAFEALEMLIFGKKTPNRTKRRRPSVYNSKVRNRNFTQEDLRDLEI